MAITFLSYNQVSLPSNVDTLYWCKLYKMPALRRKHHYIGVSCAGLFCYAAPHTGNGRAVVVACLQVSFSRS